MALFDVAIGTFFLLCTVFSILTDVLTKDILSKKLSVTATLVQFFVSSVCGFAILFVFRLHKPQTLTFQRVKMVMPLMFFQAVGFLFTNYSIASVAVSFVHTIKSSESAFTALLSFVVLGRVYSGSVYASLVPMIVGIGLCSSSEFSFSYWGLISGLISNICFSCRSVYSELVFKEKVYDDINLYWLMCTGAFVIVLPISLFFEFPLNHLDVLTDVSFVGKMVACGALHYTYNMFSFMILSRTSPLTHVVLHAVRRMLVIIFAIVWFANPVNMQNVAGMALVFIGVFWYTLARSSSAQPAKLKL